MKIGAMNPPTADPVSEIYWLKENGFDFIDFTYEPFSFPYKLDDLKKALKKTGLGIVGHTNPTLPLIYPLPTIRRAAFSELKKSFEILSELGAQKINIHPFTLSPHMTEKYKIDENYLLLEKANNYCKSLGVTLMVENFLFPYDQPKLFKNLLKNVPGLKMHLDIGHCNIHNNVVRLTREFFDELGQNIIHIHIHDNRGKKDDHMPIGCGEIDWQRIFSLLKKAEYDNTITLEVFCADRDYLSLARKKLEDLWIEH